jgi:mono/diheme cytochrome c family protein
MTRVVLVAAGLLLVMQLVPLDRSNPAVTAEVDAPEAARAVLRRACYDCHSHETRWPWYAYVAPVSFLVAHDVGEAREHLNFSTWDRYTPEKARKKIDEILEEIEEGEMPLFYYVWMHSAARLSSADREAIEAWVAGVNVSD